MALNNAADDTIGYLSIVQDDADGFFGGYLIVTPTGRPVEFHCTTPVVANRAQEILFGDSLHTYVCGELIGQKLLAQAAHSAAVILVDSPDLASTQRFTQIPLGWLDCDAGQRPDRAVSRGDALPHQEALLRNSDRGGSSPSLVAFRVPAPLDATYTIQFADWIEGSDADRPVDQLLRTASKAIDLKEPFQRIRMAIAEARRMSAA